MCVQDATADELAEHIREFVSRLPKPIKASTKEEPVPDHIREMIDEATGNVHHHGFSDHDHNGLGHGYGLEVGYPTDYGLRPEL